MSLIADLEAYLARTGSMPSRFGRLATGDPSLVSTMRAGRSVGAAVEAKVRAAMAAHASGVGGIRQHRVTRAAPKGTRTTAIRDEVAREARAAAERHEQARGMGIGSAFLPVQRDPVAAVMIAAGPQTVGEAIELVKRRWPETWARLVALARRSREAPGAVMVELIERGLQELR